MIKKNISKVPKKDKERNLRVACDTDQVIQEWKAKREKIKDSSKMICVRLPEAMLKDLKLMAGKYKIPYQTLLKILLAERLEQELGS